MQQLTFVRPGRVEWRETPTPRIEGPAQAVVRPLAVARCDLDLAIVRGEAPLSQPLLRWCHHRLPAAIHRRTVLGRLPFRGPFALGHEAVAEVVEVGSGVRHFQPGDRVCVPFQISCGECERCRRGLTNSCRSVPPRSMYGLGSPGPANFGGMLAELARVPFADAMLVKVPSGLSARALASLADNVPDGYRTVAPFLTANPAQRVLVVGGKAQSVGLYAAAVAVALGAAAVDYLDHDRARLDLAEKVGARVIAGPYPARAGTYDLSVDASADPAGLACALRSLEPGGTCTSVGIYYSMLTPLPVLEMYASGVTFITGRVQARPCLEPVLNLIESGRLRPEAITTRVADWSDAAIAIDDPGAKLVIARPGVE